MRYYINSFNKSRGEYYGKRFKKKSKIHKNVGLFKSTIERKKTRIKIREKENRLGRSLTREEKKQN